MSEPDERLDTDDWRLVKAGEVAPIKGGHGSWVETDHPAVIACMGSVPECAANGCQAEQWQRERNEAKQLLARAAMEINVAGPVHERIQVLRRHLTKAAEEEIAKREAADARVQALEAAVRSVLDTFRRDEAQGYRSKDRQFAISILERHVVAEPRREEEREPR